MITKYWTVNRAGSSLHQTKQCRLSTCKCFISEQRKICAKAKLHTQERLLHVSKSQNVKVNYLSLFYCLLYLYIHESQTINSQRWCPHPIPTILWQSDVSIILKSLFQGSCCESTGITVRIAAASQEFPGIVNYSMVIPTESLLLTIPSKQDHG